MYIGFEIVLFERTFRKTKLVLHVLIRQSLARKSSSLAQRMVVLLSIYRLQTLVAAVGLRPTLVYTSPVLTRTGRSLYKCVMMISSSMSSFSSSVSSTTLFALASAAAISAAFGSSANFFWRCFFFLCRISTMK